MLSCLLPLNLEWNAATVNSDRDNSTAKTASSSSKLPEFIIYKLIYSLECSLLAYRLQIGHATSERDDKVDAAKRSLITVIEPPRLRRADLRATEERVREIWDALELVRKANETSTW